jgi:hypothetical protein
LACLGACFGAVLLIARGSTDEGLNALRRTLDALPEGGSSPATLGSTQHWRNRSEGLAISRGHATLDEALMRSECDEERWYMAEFLRIKGELLRLERTPRTMHEAEEHFRRSLDIARLQEAPSWELRAAINLAQLYQREGKIIEARDALVPVYSRFTEGFQTADLKVAKAIIEALF